MAIYRCTYFGSSHVKKNPFKVESSRCAAGTTRRLQVGIPGSEFCRLPGTLQVDHVNQLKLRHYILVM